EDFDHRHARVRELVGQLREAVEPGSRDAELVDRMSETTERWWAQARGIEQEVAEGGSPDITAPIPQFGEFAMANTEYTVGLEAGRERLRTIGQNIFLGGVGISVVAVTAATLYGR